MIELGEWGNEKTSGINLKARTHFAALSIGFLKPNNKYICTKVF